MTGIAVRCPFGWPAVIETSPTLGGLPNPTLLYLTCPSATTAISRAESTGGVRRLKSACADPGLRGALDEVTQAYRGRRARLAPAGDPRPEAGIGGPEGPETASCLHAYAAALLAALSGWLDAEDGARAEARPVARAASEAWDRFLPALDSLWCADDRCARWATGCGSETAEAVEGVSGQRVAAIDIGTISVRLLVADIQSGPAPAGLPGGRGDQARRGTTAGRSPDGGRGRPHQGGGGEVRPGGAPTGSSTNHSRRHQRHSRGRRRCRFRPLAGGGEPCRGGGAERAGGGSARVRRRFAGHRGRFRGSRCGRRQHRADPSRRGRRGRSGEPGAGSQPGHRALDPFRSAVSDGIGRGPRGGGVGPGSPPAAIRRRGDPAGGRCRDGHHSGLSGRRSEGLLLRSHPSADTVPGCRSTG